MNHLSLPGDSGQAHREKSERADSLAMRSRKRLVMLAAALVAAVIVISGRLAYWQVISEDEILSRADSPVRTLMPRRGAIFDRRGYPLAVESYTYAISASPNQIEDPAEVARQLAKWLDPSMEEIWNAIRDSKKRYAPLARNVDIPTGEAIEALALDGINATKESQRSYPNGALAGHLFGFVNQEGRASFGLEEYYDRELRGRKGSSGGAGLQHRLRPAQDGYDLVLTIDRVIQAMVEEKLAAGVEEYSATGGTVVVMQPETGAILAMASYPPFNPNEYATTPEEQWLNPAIGAQYEPGSVVKVLTLAAGLDAGIVAPDSHYDDRGTITYGGVEISNWDLIAHGRTSIARMLQLSLNLGAVHIAEALGRARFYDYMQAFGLGQPTGIDLAGETPGLLRTPTDHPWHTADLATNSFGQGMATTPLQMVSAVAAIANDGVLMRPRVVDRIVNGETVVRQNRPTEIRRVVSGKAANETSELMVSVVEEEVTQAILSNYTVAGKTGTAQIPTPDGYHPDDTIGSFAGFAPVDDPQFVMLVKLDRPNLHRGSWTAAPLFREIAVELLQLLGVPPDNVRLARK
ncbi:MAG: Stage V sporulation protein D [Anaerolineales bacterium]|nr:Stage V sporulation protein D [Anaerolineales bacterium]